MGPKGFSSTFSLLSSFAKKSLTKRKLKRDFVSQNPRLKSLDDEKVAFEPSTYGSLRYVFRAEPYKTVALTRLSYGPKKFVIF